MKIFVFGLPHTKTLDPNSKEAFTTCAFTTKVWNLCKVMYERGHEVIHLGTEGSAPICTKHVSVASHEDWAALYGDRLRTEFYDIGLDGKYAPYMARFSDNSRKAILELGGADYSSIVCVTWGGPQQTAIKGVPQIIVESGIGYTHPFADFRVYESYAWMHMHLGKENHFDGKKWYHCVIPNMFDVSLFGPVTTEKQNYAIYLGRLLECKGVEIAAIAATRAGLPLKLVGQGDPAPFLSKGKDIEYVGPVGAEERRKLLREAKVLFCPTQYIEPFGGVAIEAQLSGCPVISSDFGAFPETVLHGLTGYRCRTLEQFIWAAKNISNIDPSVCRKWAEENYSLERVGLCYEEFFNQLLLLRGEGWMKEGIGRTELDWLNVRYPR